MTTKEAIRYVLEKDKQANRYRLSKALGCSHTTIKNYFDGKSAMSNALYEKFKEVYPSIIIDDVYKIEEYKLGELK